MQAYRRTPIGVAILSLLGCGALAMLGAILAAGSHPILVSGVVALLVCAILFPSMTVEVREKVLRWRFGLGIIRRSVPAKEIESVRIVRNPWHYGWGIRLTPHGWLYNVSGLVAVEIRLKSGTQFRLGTDDPERLVRAIQDAQATRLA